MEDRRIADFSREAFSDERRVKVEVPMLESLYREVLQFTGERGWGEEEGLLALLAAGLAYLRGQDRRGEPAGEEERLRREVERLSAQYAVMKYRAYVLTHDHQALEWAEQALRAENRLLKGRLDIARREEDALRERVAQLEAKVARLQRELESLRPGGVTSPRPLWRRLFRRP